MWSVLSLQVAAVAENRDAALLAAAGEVEVSEKLI
jgi:hypothetical protein